MVPGASFRLGRLAPHETRKFTTTSRRRNVADEIPAVTRVVVRTTVPRGVPARICETQMNDCEPPVTSENAGQETTPPGPQAKALFVQLGVGVLEARRTWASFRVSTLSAMFARSAALTFVIVAVKVALPTAPTGVTTRVMAGAAATSVAACARTRLLMPATTSAPARSVVPSGRALS